MILNLYINWVIAPDQYIYGDYESGESNRNLSIHFQNTQHADS